MTDRQAEGRALLAARLREYDAELERFRQQDQTKAAKSDARRSGLTSAGTQVMIQAFGTVLGGAILAGGAVLLGVIRVTPAANLVMVAAGLGAGAAAALLSRRGARADRDIIRQNTLMRHLVEQDRIVREYGLDREPSEHEAADTGQETGAPASPIGRLDDEKQRKSREDPAGG